MCKCVYARVVGGWWAADAPAGGIRQCRLGSAGRLAAAVAARCVSAYGWSQMPGLTSGPPPPPYTPPSLLYNRISTCGHQAAACLSVCSGRQADRACLWACMWVGMPHPARPVDMRAGSLLNRQGKAMAGPAHSAQHVLTPAEPYPHTPLPTPHRHLLSSHCRNAFGNNPDTSKALRFLVAEDRIVRAGAGGRKDPYSYVVRQWDGWSVEGRWGSGGEGALEPVSILLHPHTQLC